MVFALEGGLLLLAAWLLAELAEKLKFPRLVGMLAAGVMLQAVNLPLPESELTLSTLSSDIRMAILALVLLRAGLGLHLTQFKSAGTAAIRIGLLPLFGEILFISLAGIWLLGFSFQSSLVLGCLIGAISPAIVIPGLLELIETRRGKSKELLQTLLVGATIDNVVAVIALGAALEFALAHSLRWADFFWILPLKIAGGALLGWIASSILLGLQNFRPLKDARLGGITLWLVACSIVITSKYLDVSFVFGILIAGSLICSKKIEWSAELSSSLKDIWQYAQYPLFGLIGYAVVLKPLTHVGLVVVGVILMGQLGRALFSLVSTAGKSMHKNQRLACVLSYIPKATIQAAFAALPLDKGMQEGPLILGTAIVAIILTAPIGMIGLHHGVRRLLPP